MSCSYNIFGTKFEFSGTNWVEKTPISIFSTFGSKINEFEKKKIRKKQKKFKKPQRCRLGNYPMSNSHSIWNISHGKSRQSTSSTPTTENHKWLKVVGIKISFEHVDSWAKSLHFRTHHLLNATTELILVYISAIYVMDLCLLMFFPCFGSAQSRNWKILI